MSSSQLTVVAVFCNDAVIVDQYGFLPLQAYGELKNRDWRFAAGLQFDVFAPGAPTILPFSVLNASGNATTESAFTHSFNGRSNGRLVLDF